MIENVLVENQLSDFIQLMGGQLLTYLQNRTIRTVLIEHLNGQNLDNTISFHFFFKKKTEFDIHFNYIKKVYKFMKRS